MAITLPSHCPTPTSFGIVLWNIYTVYVFDLSNLYECLMLRLPDVETNPPRGPAPDVCTVHCSNVRSLSQNLSDLTVPSSQCVYRCACTLWFQIHVTCRSCCFLDLVARPVLFRRDRMPRAWGMAAYVRDRHGAFHQLKSECCWCEILVFSVCGAR